MFPQDWGDVSSVSMPRTSRLKYRDTQVLEGCLAGSLMENEALGSVRDAVSRKWGREQKAKIFNVLLWLYIQMNGGVDPYTHKYTPVYTTHTITWSHHGFLQSQATTNRLKRGDKTLSQEEKTFVNHIWETGCYPKKYKQHNVILRKQITCLPEEPNKHCCKENRDKSSKGIETRENININH